MKIYFSQHFGMTYGVSDFQEVQKNDGKWQSFNHTETRIPQNYHAVRGYERDLSWGCERIARIALGIFFIIATLGFGLLTESVRRCFTGRQVLIVVIPNKELLNRLDYYCLAVLPKNQIKAYEKIKNNIPELDIALPDWNSDEAVTQWANSVIEAMKNHYPLQEEKGEEFVVDYEAAAYGYMRDQMDGAFIEDERKSILVCNIDQLMYDKILTRLVEFEQLKGLKATYAPRSSELAQRFYDVCRAQGISNLNNREKIYQDLYQQDREQGLAGPVLYTLSRYPT